MARLPARPSDPNASGTVQSARLSRRGLLRAAGAAGLGAVAAGALSGCGTPLATGLAGSSDALSTVNFWNLFSGGDGTRMQQMEAAYRKSHPGVALRASTFTWGDPYYTKLALATLGDRPPEVAVAHATRMNTLARAGLLQELKPQDLARHGITPDQLDARALSRCTLDGVQYAIPLDTHPFVLYVNTDVARKAGLLGSDGHMPALEGRDAFLDALREAKRAAGWGAVMSINNDTSMCWRLFYVFYGQLGGKLLGDNGATVLLDTDQATEACELIATLTKEGLLASNTDIGGAISLFTTGKAGFLWDGEWDVTTVETTPTKFDMVPFPRVFTEGPYVVQADSHTLVLPRWRQEDPERLDVCLQFVRSLLGDSLIWSKGGHIPAWLPVRRSKAYGDLTPQSHYASSAQHALYDPPAWYSGSGSTLENTVGGAVQELLAGRATPAGTATAIRRSLTDLAGTPGPL